MRKIGMSWVVIVSQGRRRYRKLLSRDALVPPYPPGYVSSSTTKKLKISLFEKSDTIVSSVYLKSQRKVKLKPAGLQQTES